MPDDNAPVIARTCLPIVLGVTGHRDLRDADRPALQTAVAAVLREFRDAYPNTPIVLLSSLAAGADQLAADVALEIARETGASKGEAVVRAPLPMPAAVYRCSTSFSTDEQRGRFDAMQTDPQVDSFEVPLPAGVEAPDEATWKSVATSEDPAARAIRRTCYAAAGVYVTRHCHALIALWDGKGTAATRFSGTAEMVGFALTGEPPAALPQQSLEPLGYRGDRVPVIVIHTPRAGTEDEDSPAGSIRAGDRDVRLPAEKEPFGLSLGKVRAARRVGVMQRLWLRVLASLGAPEEHSAQEARKQRSELRQLHSICQTVDDFNADVRRAHSSLDEKRLRNLGASLATSAPAAGRLGDRLRDIAAVRECAAYLASVLDVSLRRAQVALFALLLIALGLFHAYAHWFAAGHGHPVHQPAFLWAFLAMLVISTILVATVWLIRLDQRRYDYRALAEALRVRRAWALAGLAVSVADSYLGQLRSEMAWARKALLQICPPPQAWADAFAKSSAEERMRSLQEVKTTWVADQLKHFRRGHRDCHRKARRYRRAGFALAVGGWAIWLTPWVDVQQPEAYLLILSGLLVVGGGMLIAISERRSYEELAKQYERMWLVFRNGEIELEKRIQSQDLAGAQAVLLALGREAITENAQWLILRRARPFELHIG